MSIQIFCSFLNWLICLFVVELWMGHVRLVVSNSLRRHGRRSLPGSSVHGIFQARILEWVAISCSRGSSQPRDWTRVSRTLYHLSHQGSSLSFEFYLYSEYWTLFLGNTCFWVFQLPKFVHSDCLLFLKALLYLQAEFLFIFNIICASDIPSFA